MKKYEPTLMDMVLMNKMTFVDAMFYLGERIQEHEAAEKRAEAKRREDTAWWQSYKTKTYTGGIKWK
jgi:hypothetical protein